MRVVLISCVKSKLSHPAKAAELYTSPLFRYNHAYARSFKPDAIYILSAKYGLVPLNKKLEPYELTLNTMSGKDVRTWSEKVKKQMKGKVRENDEVIFLAGEKYRKYLASLFKKHRVPMQGLGLGKQLAYLKRHVSL